MIRVAEAFFRVLFPVVLVPIPLAARSQFAGERISTQRERWKGWHKKDEVLWFNGYPGSLKLPLVQRLRASPFVLNPEAPFEPEKGVEEGEDPEPLCRNKHLTDP